MQHEAYEQRKVIEYCKLRKIKVFAIPNGGKRSLKEAYFLKLEGCSAGVPDLCIPKPNAKHHGLFIEMKYGKNKPTENQKEWIEYLNSVGYLAVVCYSADEAFKLLNKYFSDKV